MAVDAIAEWKKLVAKDGNDTRALLRLAEQHVKAGAPETACEVYAQAGDVFVRQGFARRAISAFTQAMECARAQAATHGRVGPIARALAKLYAKEKLPREALAVLDGAAKFLVERGADAQAIAVLEERIAMADDDVARVRLAEALSRVGDVDHAVEELTALLAHLRAKGARDEAIQVAERLLHHRRDHVVARVCAEMYLARNRAGDPFLALAKLRVCCERDAAHVPTLELLARAFVLAKHPDKAARVRREIEAILGRLAPRKKDDSSLRAVDEGWEELIEAPKPIDVARPSFWAVPDADLPDDSVVDVSLDELELVDGAPASHERASLLETALECVDSLVAQGRYDEASLLLARHLEHRPNNPLLIERKSEVDAMKNGVDDAPPSALFGVPRARRESERTMPTACRATA